MEINWFTVIAQIVNFLILLALLKRFLFNRVVAAMDKREKEISNRLQEADYKRQQAEQQETSFRDKEADLQSHWDDEIQKAQKQAEQKQHALVAQARSEVDVMKQKWQRALDNEMNAFMQSMRQVVSRQFFAVSRRALKDLADTRLEEQMLNTFLHQLEQISDEDRDAVKKAAGADEQNVHISSTFELDAEMKRKITAAIHDLAGKKTEPQYATSEALLCGIELRADGCRLGWNLDDYLDDIESEVTARIGTLRYAGREVQEEIEDSEVAESAESAEGQVVNHDGN